MKRTVIRLAIVAAVLVAALSGLDKLADATQTRADVRHDDQATEIVIEVEGKRYRQSLTTAAMALWGTCSATVAGDLTEDGIVEQGDGRFMLAVTPSLGHHGKERLLGCLRDLTIERLKSSVVSVTDVPYAKASAAG
jgi:hypothetical protein